MASIGSLALAAAIGIGLATWPSASASAAPAPSALSRAAHPATKVAMASRSGRPTVRVQVKKTAPKRRIRVAAKRKPRVRATAWRSARVSWYGPGFYGNTMAGGGRLTRNSMVVAHRTLRFGTRVQISYRGRTTIAVVKDRGPYVYSRQFDLGPGIAKTLGFQGVGTIKYRILKPVR